MTTDVSKLSLYALRSSENVAAASKVSAYVLRSSENVTAISKIALYAILSANAEPKSIKRRMIMTDQ